MLFPLHPGASPLWGWGQSAQRGSLGRVQVVRRCDRFSEPSIDLVPRRVCYFGPCHAGGIISVAANIFDHEVGEGGLAAPICLKFTPPEVGGTVHLMRLGSTDAIVSASYLLASLRAAPLIAL